MPGDRRVAGGGNLRRSRVADLALHSPEITQAGVMAYVEYQKWLFRALVTIV